MSSYNYTQQYTQLYRLPLLGSGDIDSLSTRLLFPPPRDGERLSRCSARRGGVIERDIDLVRLRPLRLSFPFLRGGVLDIDRDRRGSLARAACPTLEREFDRDLIDRDLERLERPRLDRDRERLECLSLARDVDRDGGRDLDRDLDRDLESDGLRPRLADLE
jgi:hypothetical protein